MFANSAKYNCIFTVRVGHTVHVAYAYVITGV